MSFEKSPTILNLTTTKNHEFALPKFRPGDLLAMTTCLFEAGLYLRSNPSGAYVIFYIEDSIKRHVLANFLIPSGVTCYNYQAQIVNKYELHVDDLSKAKLAIELRGEITIPPDFAYINLRIDTNGRHLAIASKSRKILGKKRFKE